METLPATITDQTALAQPSALQSAVGDALGAQVEAQVKARYALAIRNPRNLDLVRQKVLRDCDRPRFAEVARYKKPQGKRKNERTGKWEEAFIEGPSIRFAEAAMRAYGNIAYEATVVFDDDKQRMVRVQVMDLEANLTASQDVVVRKSVERRDGKGREVLGQRKNSYGDTVFVVEATDDEVMVKQAALVSKALRTCALRLIPGDIVEEAMDRVQETQARADKTDPDAARKRLLDWFAAQGVMPDALVEYLGHDLMPGDFKHLREVAQAIKDGETTWAELTRPAREETAPAQTADPLTALKAKGAAK